MNIQNNKKLIKSLKTVNIFLAITLLAVASVGCSSLTKKNTSNDHRKATLVSPKGKVVKVTASDSNEKVRLPRVTLSKSKKYCNQLSNENRALKQNEMDLELSYMINSLNNQKPLKSKKGIKFRKLSSNMIKNLNQVPDCDPYRFKLNVISKLVRGHKLESMDD